MSVASELTRIKGAKDDLKASINAKTDSEHQITDETIDNYADFVDSITSGGGTSKYAPRTISFYYKNTFTELDYETANLDTKNMTNMRSMFYGCSSLERLDLLHFNTSNVTDMSQMFYNCQGLTSLDLSSFNTKKVTSMESMFRGCAFLKTLNISNFTSDVLTKTSSMFANCARLEKLDMRNFDFSNITNYTDMFGGTYTSIKTSCLIIVKDDTAKTWITSKFSRLTNVKTVAEYEASL